MAEHADSSRRNCKRRTLCPNGRSRVRFANQPRSRCALDESAWIGAHRGNQLACKRSVLARNKFSRCVRRFQPLRFDHELVSRVGRQARSDKATARIRGTGLRWRSWWRFHCESAAQDSGCPTGRLRVRLKDELGDIAETAKCDEMLICNLYSSEHFLPSNNFIYSFAVFAGSGH